jgi:ubiquinone biosynthesis protein COQ4
VSSSTTGDEHEAAPDPLAQRTVEWRRAWRALRTLLADPERTDQVFELIQAVGGSANADRVYQRCSKLPEGQRLLAERPSLFDALADFDQLESLPEGSFGRAYAAFMRAENLSTAGLADAAAAAGPRRVELDPERTWFYDRLRDMHDLWHVLTGYGRDLAGEAANLAFTYGQTRGRGVGVIVLAAALRGPKHLDLRWQRYLLRAWRRGRKAAALPLARYEQLLPLPLDEVRCQLRIQPAREAHPGGIIVSGAAETAAAAAA